MKQIQNLLAIVLVLGIISSGASAAFEISLFAATMLSIGFIAVCAALPHNKMSGVTNNGISVERWVDYVVERFYKDNAFMKLFASHDDYVEGGKTVHIPQPGAKPTVNKNPSSWPLSASQRTDTIVSYDLNHYITNPTHITNAEAAEISYNKMDSVLGDHMAVINERAADEQLIAVLDGVPSANIVYTTGGASANTTAGKVSGQTGNRYTFDHVDLKKVGLLMNLQNLPKVQRHIILESNMLDELTDSLNASQLNAFNQYYNAQTGLIGKLYGIEIYERSSVAVAAAALDTGTLDVDAYGAAVGATDLVVSLAFYGKNVARAMGTVNPMHDTNRPEYGGDIMNVELRFGGRRKYTNAEGVIAIAQGTPA